MSICPCRNLRAKMRKKVTAAENVGDGDDGCPTLVGATQWLNNKHLGGVIVGPEFCEPLDVSKWFVPFSKHG